VSIGRHARRVAIGAAGAAAVGAAALWWLGARSAPAPRALGPPPDELGAAMAIVFPSDSWAARSRGLVVPDACRAAVVLAHAVRSELARLVGRAALLHRAGYTACCSTRRRTERAPRAHHLRPSRGAGRARGGRPGARASRRSGSDTRRVGGGAAALLGPAPLAVDALVLEAVYPTLREAIVARIGIRLGPLAPYLAPLLLVQVRARLGVGADAIAPIEGMRDIRAPLLLIAGEDDRHTPLAQSRRLFDAAPEPKSLWSSRAPATSSSGPAQSTSPRAVFPAGARCARTVPYQAPAP
jgi:fermentation-respiration switch protein FrsA (DUF1100 family)